MTDTQGNTAEEITAPAIPAEEKPAESNEPQLPDGVAERTKEEFEKLKAHNSELKKQLDAYNGKTSVLDELKPAEVPVETPNLSTTKVAEIKSKFVDENGYVDVDAFESALNRAEERARRAEEKAEKVEKKIQNSEETAQVKAAHAEYPVLDPHSEQFDPKFYELVKLNMIGQMMNGKSDLLAAAREVSKLYTPAPKASSEEVRKEKVAKREQATESVSGRGRGESSDKDELIMKTQAGDTDALYKRLQASGN